MQSVTKSVSQSYQSVKSKLQVPQSNTVGGKGIEAVRVSVTIQFEEPYFASINLTIDDILDKQDGGHEQRICEQ